MHRNARVGPNIGLQRRVRWEMQRRERRRSAAPAAFARQQDADRQALQAKHGAGTTEYHRARLALLDQRRAEAADARLQARQDRWLLSGLIVGGIGALSLLSAILRAIF